MNAPDTMLAQNHKPPDLKSAREDLTAALRWSAHLGLNEGICNHFSYEWQPDQYLINPQGLHWGEVCASDMLLIDGQGQVIEGRHGIEPTAFLFIPGFIASILMRRRSCTLTCLMPRPSH